MKAVEEKEAKLKDEYEKLNTLQTSLVSQQTEAQNLISSKEAQIAEIQNQITDNANLLADLKAKAEAAKRLQEEQAAAAAAAAAAKKNNSGSSSNGSSSSRPASSGNVVSGSGYFTHPCPGMTYQSSYFVLLTQDHIKEMIMLHRQEHLHMQQQPEQLLRQAGATVRETGLL